LVTAAGFTGAFVAWVCPVPGEAGKVAFPPLLARHALMVRAMIGVAIRVRILWPRWIVLSRPIFTLSITLGGPGRTMMILH
jgi:hypothetical protein